MSQTTCYCKNISQEEIKIAIENGAKDLKDIQNSTGACTGNKCKELNPTGKCCSSEVMKILGKSAPEIENSCSCCN